MEIMMIALAKILDNILATSKTILIQKGKAIMAALSVIISNIIFYLVVSQVVNSDSNIKMLVASTAGGVGTYIAIQINNKMSKGKTYVNNIMSDDREFILDICNQLREHKIKNLVTDSYTKNWEKTLSLTVFAETKEDSKLVDKILEKSNGKYLRIIK